MSMLIMPSMKYIILPLFLFFLGGCGLISPPEKKHNKTPIILVSIAPYKKLLKEIAHNKVDVISVIPPDIDPHNWEPTYRDVADLQEALAWFTIGERFENRLLEKLEKVGAKLEAVSLANVALKEFHGPLPETKVNLFYTDAHHGHHHALDTHFWLDPLLMIAQARAVRDTLSDLFPKEAAFFTENFLKLKEKLTNLDNAQQLDLAFCKGKILATSHGAYTYYCFRYGLYQLTIEPFSGKEPRAKEISALTEEMRKKQTDLLAIIMQPQHTNKAAKILAHELSLPLFVIDPYGEDYEETISSLTQALLLARAHEKTSLTTTR